MSPVFQGVFLTTGPPGKPLYSLLYICKMVFAEHKPLMGCDSQQRKSKPQTSPLYWRASGEFKSVNSWRPRTPVNWITIRGFTALYYWSRERNEIVQLKGHVVNWKCESESHSVLFNSFQPHGLYSPWNSLGQNTGVGSLSLLQGIFPTQGSNPGLPHCRWILYQLSHR